jgi:predicted ATPase/lipopolysaccharide biosynthesis regulator YciM
MIVRTIGRENIPISDFQPKLVGREDEVQLAQAFLDKARNGHGNTIFISGEAGVGKTRLVNEVKGIAQSMGFKTLTGYNVSESLSPFLPFIDALRSGGMESLFMEEAPCVEAVYLVTHSGLLIKDIVREETTLDPDIFSSLFITVNEFISQSLSTLLGQEKEGTLNSLGFESYRILIESGKNANLVVVISGKENEFLINDIKESVRKIQDRFQDILKNWDGDNEKVEEIGKLIDPLITSGKYDGIYYGKEDPKARRNLLFENVSMGLSRQAKTTPTLLFIEDLQWADPSSLALMHYITRNTKDSGLLILGTYRPEDVAAEDGKGHPLTGTMQLMDREDLLHKMELPRLPENCIDEFLTSMLQSIDFTDDFKKKIYKETEGNPLFIIEMVTFLTHEDFIQKFEGTWKLVKPLEAGTIPSKVLSVISRRLDRVQKEDRKALDYASVIGEVFDSTLLANILGMDRISLLERLRYLEQTHRLIHPQNGNFKFDHAKIKEALYNEIPLELKSEYHFKVANSLETMNKDNFENVIGDLAFHFYHSKDRQKALLYLYKAAEIAKKDYSNEEAIKFYNFALELEEDRDKRLHIFENLGAIYELIGNFNSSIKSLQEALNLSDLKRKKAELTAKIGGVYEKHRKFEEAIKFCNEALELVKGEDCKEEALALNNLGKISIFVGEFDKALDCFEKSQKISEKIQDQIGIASSLASMGFVYECKGEFNKIPDCLHRSLDIFEEVGFLPGIAEGLKSIGTLYERRGEFDKALEYLNRSLEFFDKTGDQLGSIPSLTVIGDVNWRRGDFDEALKWLEKGQRISDKMGDAEYSSVYFSTVGSVHWQRGEFEKAIDHYQKNLKDAEKIGSPMAMAAALCFIACPYAEMGEYDKALDYFDKSMKIAQEIGTLYGIVSNLFWPCVVYNELGEYDKSLVNLNKSKEILDKMEAKWALASLYWLFAECYIGIRDFEKALKSCNRSFDLSMEIGAKWFISESKKDFGIIFREQEKWEESIKNFEESIKGFDKIGMVPFTAKVHYEFGLMWKAKGEPEKARVHLNKALDIFDKLKLEKRAEKVKIELDALKK